MCTYPLTSPFDSGRLDVGEGHEIAYWQYGNPKGIKAVYLHGGPGGGSAPQMSTFFDSTKYHIILFDQRGCGQSTPHAELTANTTWHLVSDLEKLRQHFKCEQWLVCGGSWGSTLALAYAQTYPEVVSGLILRGIFTLRRQELLWFYQEGASWIYPDLWQAFIEPIPEVERGDLMSAYYRRLTGTNEIEKQRCAKSWSTWEGATLSLLPDLKRQSDFSDQRFALAFARIECHYFIHGGFFTSDGQLIKNAAQLNAIPGIIIQGRYDIVTPMKTAWELHRAWEKSRLCILPTAGHAATEPEIKKAIVDATCRFATQGHFN